MPVKTYNSEEVQVIIGTRRIRGLAEGSFVSIDREADTFSKSVGSDGEVSRSKTNNRSGTISITLQNTSEDNAYLMGLHNTDENSGAGIVPAKVIDKNGTYVAIATESWIQKPATSEFSNEITTRQWVVACGNLDLSGGGN